MRLLIVEDSATVRLQLRKLLALVPGLDVVGEATSQDGAIAAIERLRPDAVLLDLRLTPGSGVNVLRAMQAQGLTCRTLVLSNETDPRYKTICLGLGAEGFFDKSLEMKAALEQISLWSRAFAAGGGEAA